MKKIYLILSLLGALFILGSLSTLSAQNKEFWFVVPDADQTHSDNPVFFMITAGAKSTKVTLSMPQNVKSATNTTGFATRTKELKAYESWQIPYTARDTINMLENSVYNSYEVTKKGILIKSDEEISAYYELDGNTGQKEIFTLKGEKALGTEFYTPFQSVYSIIPGLQYNSFRQIQIVAADDNTEVVFTPTSNVSVSAAGGGGFLVPGQPYSKILNRGETLLIREHERNVGAVLMGTHIITKDAENKGNKKRIAVTVYEDSVHSNGDYDPIGDQIVPANAVGTSYIVVNGYSRLQSGNNAQDHVYILATKPNTKVTMYTETSPGTMTTTEKTIPNAGGSVYFAIGDQTANPQYRVFESDKPVYCYHQSATAKELGGALIPSMYSIASKSVTFYNQQLALNNSIFLIYRKSAQNDFKLKFKDGSAQSWTPSNQAAVAERFGGEWMYAKMPFNPGGAGVTTISNSKGAFALGYFTSPGSTALYGYLSSFGTFQFENKPIHRVCGTEYVFDVGYAKSVKWTVPNSGDYTEAELKAETLTARKSGKYKVEIDLDMGEPIKDEVTLIFQNLDSKEEFPKATFVEEETTFKIKLNPANDPDNVFNAQYKWTFEDGTPSTITNEGLSSVEQVVKVKWDKNKPGKKKITLELQNLDVGASCTRIIEDFIIVHNYPDNVSDTECKMDAPAQDWSIKAMPTSSVIYDIAQPPLVGDIDGDGVPEILAYRNTGVGTGINIIDILASDGITIKGQIKPEGSNATVLPLATMGRVKFTQEKDTVIIVTLSSGSNLLKGWNIKGENLWTSNAAHGIGGHAVTVSLADLDGDGWSELVVANKVFAAESGKLLYEIPAGNKGLSHGWGTNIYQTGVAGVLNNLKQQVIAGNAIYDITINSRTVPSQNTHIATTITPPTIGGFTAPNDGCAQAVDFDLDGNLDIVVSNVLSNQRCFVYVWSPTKNKILASAKIDNIYKKSIPFVGDIDGDGYPEIVLIHGGAAGNTASANDKITALKYDGTDVLKIFWQLNHQDTSGATTITLFDFNQDNIAELVYRDEKSLRIINGSLIHHKTGLPVSAPYDLITPIVCGSATTFEYPIVADVDGDGQAEIIAIGSNPVEFSHRGLLRIYKSDPAKAAPWAPARKVWNQFAYNAVNINEDMTVPRYPLSPATVFKGTGGDVRPYNAFLMQQTIIGKDGAPFIPLPNAQLKDKGNIEYIYDANTNKMTIKNVTIENNRVKTAEHGAVGAAPLNAIVYVTVYKVNSGVKTKLTTYNHMSSIDVDSEATFDIVIDDFESKLPIDNILISINDDGVKNPYQPVCHTCDPNESDAFKSLELDGIAWIDGGYRKCVGNKAEFKSQTTLGGSEFTKQWFKPGSSAVWKTGGTTEISSLTTADVGQYTFKATNTASNLSVTHVLPHLSVATPKMAWRTDAEDHNWNNINNWNQVNPTTGGATALKSVPAGCTSVHLPAPSVANIKYPVLLNDTDGLLGSDWTLYKQPVADTVIFHYGSELAYPHLLDYQRAQVQYNVGYYNTMTGLPNNAPANQNKEGATAPVISRDQWHPVSAPLKKMVSGDFSFGGYPFTWQGIYQGLGSSGHIQSIDFNSANIATDLELSTVYNALSLKVANYKSATGYNDHKHLQTLKGIIQMPYFEKEGEANFHPSHSYDPISRISTLYYYDHNTLQQLGSPVGKIHRGNNNEAYRFVFENNNNEIEKEGTIPTYKLTIKPVSGNKLVLIGNPFLSPINMARFYAANTGKIVNQYHIYDRTEKKWKPYACTTAGNNVNSFEAFAVELLNPAQEVTLHFPAEGTNALTGASFTGTTPRRIQIAGALSVAVSNPQGQGGAYAELSPLQSEFGNISKLISQEGHIIPEVFFVDETGNNFNLIQGYEEGVPEIALGVKCSDAQNELTLTFDRVAEFSQLNNVHPVLVDKLLGVEQDLTKNSTYHFRQHTITNGQSQYADKKRFTVRFGQEGTTATSGDNLQVIYTDGYLQVKTTVAATQVEVYNLNGQLMFNSGTINTTVYHQDLSLAQGGYVVKVKTGDNKTASRKIMTR